MPPCRLGRHKGGTVPQQNQTVDLTVTLDRDLAASGEALFNRLGMDFSMAFSTFVNHAVRQGGISFGLDDASGRENKATMRRREFDFDAGPTETEEEYHADIRRREADIDAGRNIVYRDTIRSRDTLQ